MHRQPRNGAHFWGQLQLRVEGGSPACSSNIKSFCHCPPLANKDKGPFNAKPQVEMHPTSLLLAVAFGPGASYAYLTSNGKVIVPGATSYNGLNLVPQMGWDNFNAFGCNVNESLVLNTAQTMVDYGLRDLGYNYVVIDDCWSVGRNSSGYLVANTDTFPNGMSHVADELHSMGMKMGMYSSAGLYTCAKYTGSLGYEQQDADFFAKSKLSGELLRCSMS